MDKLRLFFRNNRVVIILLGLILANLLFFQLSSSLFRKTKKVEADSHEQDKLSFYQHGIHILHIGNAVVDYLRYFGEQKDQ